MDSVLEYLKSLGLNLGENVIVAVLIVLIGFRVVKYVMAILVRTMEKANVDATLVSFLKSVLDIVLKGIIILSALTELGFPSSSIIAVLGTAGAALALGFKDNLGSFVSGIIILINKPFLVGDFIEVGGYSGTVKDIQVMDTKIATIDNRIVIIPNNTMTTATIVNYSAEEKRRVDLVFSVSYKTNLDLACNLILKELHNHPMILQDMDIFARVSSFEASSIDITVRAWCYGSDYFTVKFDLLENVKKAFDANGVEIPYNQIDVHIVENKG